MNVRITGTSEEVKKLTELLPIIADFENASKEYPNRGSNEVRVYLNQVKIEDRPYVGSLKEYAKEKKNVQAMLLLAATDSGILQSISGTKKSAMIKILYHILEGAFKESIYDFLSEHFSEEIQEMLKKEQGEEIAHA